MTKALIKELFVAEGGHHALQSKKLCSLWRPSFHISGGLTSPSYRWTSMDCLRLCILPFWFFIVNTFVSFISVSTQWFLHVDQREAEN